MTVIRYASSLDTVHRQELEFLLYFNSGQDRVRDGIVESIDRFGLPQIVDEGGRVRVALEGTTEIQNLFVIQTDGKRPRLAGVALFFRADQQTIVVTHIGVAQQLPDTDRNGGVFFSLLAKIQEISRRIKGVRYVELIYGPSRSRRLRIRK